MGMFLINVLGFLGLLLVISFVASLTYRFVPEEAKKTFYRNRLTVSWNHVLEEAEADAVTTLVIPARHRNVSKEAMDALKEYTLSCVWARSREAFEDIELGDGFFVASLSFKTLPDALEITYGIKRAGKKYLVRPSVFNQRTEVSIQD